MTGTDSARRVSWDACTRRDPGHRAATLQQQVARCNGDQHGNRLADSVSIAGVGCTRFGDLLSTEEAGLSLQELAGHAVLEAP